MTVMKASETTTERAPGSQLEQLRRACDERDRVEAEESKGSAELYWSAKCHRVERHIWFEEAKAGLADACARAAREASRQLQRLLPSRAAQGAIQTHGPDTAGPTQVSRLASENLAALQGLERLGAQCAQLESEALDWGVPAANHESALSLLQFEESVLMSMERPPPSGFRRAAELVWPSHMARLEAACNQLEHDIGELRRDASLIEAYVAQIEKIGATAPYSSELQGLLMRCQELAIRHQRDLPMQNLP